jgi:hypothetical protein
MGGIWDGHQSAEGEVSDLRKQLDAITAQRDAAVAALRAAASPQSNVALLVGVACLTVLGAVGAFVLAWCVR